MQNKQTVFFLTLLLLLCSYTSVFSQITIGVSDEPVTGALLQLKQDEGDTGGANSRKGMILPRVVLTDLNKLMMDGTAEYTGVDRDSHLGLVVYNVNENRCADDPIFKGAYVWSGTKWELLRKEEAPYFIENDQEGKPFKARDFGPQAGVWMLENLAVTKYADGTPIPMIGNLGADVAGYGYPRTDATKTEWNTPMPEWKRHHGLLYTFPTISRGYIPAQIDQKVLDIDMSVKGNEVEVVLESTAGAKNGKLQGPCPNNWHVPSDREWSELEKVIYNDISKYSTYAKDDKPTPDVWNDQWGVGWWIWDRPSGLDPNNGIHGHSLAILNPCLTPGLSSPPSGYQYGKSLLGVEGGFDAYRLGLITGYLNQAMTAASYGKYAYFWTSSRTSPLSTIDRRFDSASSVYRGNGDLHIPMSIRCKKD